MSMPRPTKGDIYSLYRMAENHYGELHSRMLRAVEMERRDFGHLLTGLLAGQEIRIPNTGQVAVNVLVDHVLLGDNPEITVTLPPGQFRATRKERENIELIQGWLNGAFHRLNSQSIESPIRDMVSQTANPGIGVLAYDADLDGWPQEPARKDGETGPDWRKRRREYDRERAMAWPFDVRSCPPTTIFPDPAHDPPHWYIEVRKRLRKEFSELPEDSRPYEHGKFAGQQVEVEEVRYQSAEWYAIYVNQQPVLTEDHGADQDGVAPNPWGRVCYQRAINGTGKNDYDNRPEYKIEGLLYPVADILLMETEAINQINAVRRTQAYGSPTATHPGGVNAAKEALAANPIRVGDITFLDPLVKLGVLELPPLDPSVFQTLDIIRGLIEMSLVTSTLRGIGQAGDAAAKYRTMVAEARLKYQATRESCQMAVAGMFMAFLDIIRDNEDIFAAGVSQYGTVKGETKLLTLKPEMIMPGLMVTVKFSPTTAEEKAFLLEQGLQLLQPGPNGEPSKISMYTFLKEFALRPDPEAEMDRIYEDKVTKAVMDFAAQVAVSVAQIRLRERAPDVFAMLQAQQIGAPPGTNGASAQPIPQPGPEGFTAEGEQPVAPPLGGSEDMMRSQGLTTLTQTPRF